MQVDLRSPWWIGDVEIPTRLVLAPMAGVSVQAFRRQGRRYGAGLVCSEMVSCAGLHHKNERTLGYLRISADERPLAVQIFGSEPAVMSQFTDPLSGDEWWPSHVGAEQLTMPGPGVPLTLIDSGVDLAHEEFAGRPNTFALNPMSFSGNDEELHGTATASVAAAPQNGVGIVGVYPQAKLQLWDASPQGQLTVGDEIDGLFAARKRGPGVVNLSLGGFDRIPIEEHAIMCIRHR